MYHLSLSIYIYIYTIYIYMSIYICTYCICVSFIIFLFCFVCYSRSVLLSVVWDIVSDQNWYALKDRVDMFSFQPVNINLRPFRALFVPKQPGLHGKSPFSSCKFAETCHDKCMQSICLQMRGGKCSKRDKVFTFRKHRAPVSAPEE